MDDTNWVVVGGDGDNSLTLGNGVDHLTLGDGDNTIAVGNGTGDTIVVGSGANTIDLGTGPSAMVQTGSGDNLVRVSAAALRFDRVQGGVTTGDGTGNTLALTTPGIVCATDVSGFQIYQLADGGENYLLLTDMNFRDLPAGTITVQGGDWGNTVEGVRSLGRTTPSSSMPARVTMFFAAAPVTTSSIYRR